MMMKKKNSSQESEENTPSQDQASLANLESPKSKISQKCIGDIEEKKDCSEWAIKQCKGFDAGGPGCSGKCQFRLRHSECCLRHNATCESTENEDHDENVNMENEEKYGKSSKENENAEKNGVPSNDEENKSEEQKKEEGEGHEEEGPGYGKEGDEDKEGQEEEKE